MTRCGTDGAHKQRCHGATGEKVHHAIGEGSSDMVNQRSALNATSRYENFLLAPICDEPGGMRLSVLSALARMNVDPWEEAARLAGLATADAQKTLVSTLNRFPGKRQRSAETEALAARLIALLPRADKATIAKQATIAEGPTKRYSAWLMWLCLAIAMSFLIPHQQSTTTNAESPRSTSKAASVPEDIGAMPAPSDGSSRSELGKAHLPAVPTAGATSP